MITVDYELTLCLIKFNVTYTLEILSATFATFTLALVWLATATVNRQRMQKLPTKTFPLM